MTTLNKNLYKNSALDGQGLKSWREKDGVHVHQQKKEQLFKRRHVRMLIIKDEDPNDDGVTADMIEGVKSSNSAVQLSATTKIRKLLSTEPNPPIAEVISTGIIPRLVQFLENGIDCRLQLEAAWVLTNVSSGTSKHTCLVVEAGAVPPLIRLLSSDAEDVREQAVWALGNIAGDSTYWRDFVIHKGILQPVLAIVDPLINNSARLSMKRNSVWTLSNLCRGQNPKPDLYKMLACVPVLGRIIRNDSDPEVLADSCWALSYLSEGSEDIVEAIITSGVCQQLVELLTHVHPNVVSAALRTIGNLLTGDDFNTQALIRCSVLPRLSSLLASPKELIIIDACWVISNITAGKWQHIKKVVDANIFPQLIDMLRKSEIDVRKAAAWAIVNATHRGSTEQIRFLVELGCIPPLCQLLSTPDVDALRTVLNGLENILKVGEADANNKGTVNEMAVTIQECGGLDEMDTLLCHDNENIYRKCFDILERYFDGDEEGLVEEEAFCAHP